MEKKPLNWQEQIALCLKHKQKILANPRLSNAHITNSFIYRYEKEYYPTIGEMFGIWDTVFHAKRECPHCGQTMYLFGYYIYGYFMHNNASFVCPSCQSVFIEHNKEPLPNLEQAMAYYPEANLHESDFLNFHELINILQSETETNIN